MIHCVLTFHENVQLRVEEYMGFSFKQTNMYVVEMSFNMDVCSLSSDGPIIQLNNAISMTFADEHSVCVCVCLQCKWFRIVCSTHCIEINMYTHICMVCMLVQSHQHQHLYVWSSICDRDAEYAAPFSAQKNLPSSVDLSCTMNPAKWRTSPFYPSVSCPRHTQPQTV